MEPQFYQTKRYTLMVVCCISIVGSIIYAAMTPKLVDEAMKQVIYPPNTDIPTVRSTAIGLMIAAFVIAIIFQLFGLIGAWREHFCLTCTYTVLQVLGTISQVINAITHPMVWINAVINLLVCIVAISFLIDLRTIRNTRPTNHY